MNKNICFGLLMLFLYSFNLNAMHNKKRPRNSSTTLPPAKRVKNSNHTTHNPQIIAKQELKLDLEILASFQENDTNTLIQCSNWLITHSLPYITDLNTLARRMHNHHKLYLFFSKNNYPTYAQENLNLTRKYHYEWLKRSNMFS